MIDITKYANASPSEIVKYSTANPSEDFVEVATGVFVEAEIEQAYVRPGPNDIVFDVDFGAYVGCDD
jgi:hypothetical protein